MLASRQKAAFNSGADTHPNQLISIMMGPHDLKHGNQCIKASCGLFPPKVFVGEGDTQGYHEEPKTDIKAFMFVPFLLLFEYNITISQMLHQQPPLYPLRHSHSIPRSFPSH